MGCSKCQANRGNYVQPNRNTECSYTLENLNSLLAVVAPNEVPVVISQINVYSAKCNVFRNLVLPLFDKYEIPYESVTFNP